MTRAHRVNLNQIYRICYRGAKVYRFMLVLMSGPTSDARLLIWCAERHLGLRWPANKRDKDGDYEGEVYKITRMESGHVTSIEYVPEDDDGPDLGSPSEHLQVYRADQPLPKGEADADWMGVPSVAIEG